MLEQLNSVFYDEANELLDNLEEQLLTLENNPEDADTIAAVFRAMHTIKGSAAMFGFNVVSSFTHEVESTLDQVRNGVVKVTQELINLTLKARDQIRDMLNAGADISSEVMGKADVLINQFKVYVANNGGTPLENAPAAESQVSSSSGNSTSTWRIKFRPSQNILQNGTRPELLVKELNEMGAASIVPLVDKVPALSNLTVDSCYVAWDVILTTTKSRNEIEDVFIFLDSDSKFEIERIEVSATNQLRIGEILVDRGNIKQEQIDTVMNEHKQLGQILVEKKMVSPEQIKSALAEQKHLKTIGADEGAANAGQGLQPTVRVSSGKLDKLVDLVGELVTFNSHLDQLALETNMSQLRNLSETCGRLVVQLRDASMGMRMVPIGTLFQKFRRTIRDLSEQLGKNIEMVVDGADTELDKTVVEKLNDPLLHLVRNSVDHGIELPDDRTAAGKNPMGTVKLSAVHAGSFVLITISDDGKGMDKEVLRKKGIEKGLIAPNQNPTDAEIYDLVFNPGFSTAQQVTSISGRGVGLDVVKKDITSLGGNVTIDTELGRGTNFILRIPLTLAIIDGMLVQVGKTKYIIPFNTIQECSLVSKKLKSTEMFPTIELHGKETTCVNLRKFFNINDPMPEEQEVVVVNDQDERYGIIVDKILGDNQTVIKPLGDLYKSSLGISSSTILGDGSVGLVVDVFKLSEIMRMVEKDR